MVFAGTMADASQNDHALQSAVAFPWRSVRNYFSNERRYALPQAAQFWSASMAQRTDCELQRV